MGNLLVFSERKVRARGAQKGSRPDQEKIKELLFEEEYTTLSLLRQVKPFPHTNLKFLYPGCGVDLLFPLFYLGSLFPLVQEASFIFIDKEENKGMIKTILEDIGIPFSEKKKKIVFYWNHIKVQLEFITGDIFELVHSLPAFDVYFERSFRIMKDGHNDYEQNIVDKLNPGGILISDSGFQNMKLQKIDVPKELSAYGEMVVGVK